MQDNNKLIAEFMDLETPDGCYFEHLTKEGNRELTHHILLQYHTSWDWLMPVVEKIECTHDDKGDCFNVMMEAFECTISGLGLTLCLNGHTKMDATYKAVVEFINEHNKYICGSCGEGCSDYTYNEDTDTDECNDCKTSNNGYND